MDHFESQFAVRFAVVLPRVALGVNGQIARRYGERGVAYIRDRVVAAHVFAVCPHRKRSLYNGARLRHRGDARGRIAHAQRMAALREQSLGALILVAYKRRAVVFLY